MALGAPRRAFIRRRNAPRADCERDRLLAARRNVAAALSALALTTIHGAIWGFNVSRAGVILSVMFSLFWLMGLGPRYVSRRTVLTLTSFGILGIGLFLVASGELKRRLTDTVEALTPVTADEYSGPQPLAENHSVSLQGRVLIYQDTLSLIRDAPLTGVGLGLFRYVFPQYQIRSASTSRSIHPESDWLKLAAEAGWPAALLLAGGVLAALFVFGQWAAWQQLSATGQGVAVNPSNSFLYVFTGLHAAHVIGGLVVWAVTVARLRSNADRTRRSVALCATYWHFLLAVWLVLLAAMWWITPAFVTAICGPLTGATP